MNEKQPIKMKLSILIAIICIIALIVVAIMVLIIQKKSENRVLIIKKLAKLY